MSYEEAVEYLKRTAHEKHLSNKELAKRASISESQISRIFRLGSTASMESLAALSVAVNVSPEAVLRMAKHLAPQPESDPLTDEGMRILQQLEGQDKEDAIRYLRLRREVQEERQRGNARKSKTRSSTSG